MVLRTFEIEQTVNKVCKRTKRETLQFDYERCWPIVNHDKNVHIFRTTTGAFLMSISCQITLARVEAIQSEVNQLWLGWQRAESGSMQKMDYGLALQSLGYEPWKLGYKFPEWMESN